MWGIPLGSQPLAGSQADSGVLADYRRLRRVRFCATGFAALFVDTSRLRLFQP